MVINEDYSYIDSLSKLLIKNGYGKYMVFQYNFDRYFSDQQKNENLKEAKRIGNNTKEWEEHCNKSHYAFYKSANKMMEMLGEKYKIYQYNSDDYKNYDLFFYSNKGWNHKDWYDYCTLKLSDDYETNIKQNQELRNLLEEWNGDSNNLINCRIQYQAFIDKKKVSSIVKDNIDAILNKKITYGFFEGKIKWVECNNEYGFFKKGAKKYYSKLNDMNLIEILIQEKIIIFVNEKEREKQRSEHYAKSTAACKVDMWYGDRLDEVDRLDITFNDLDGKYRGNCLIKGKYVGDFVAKDTESIEKKFSHLQFNWDGDSEPMDICLTENMKEMIGNTTT